MSLDDDLKLERYKLVTERQKYFTNLASNTFASYMKIFTGLVAGGITLISAKSKLGLDPQVLLPLLDGIVYLVTFLAIAAIGQTAFCLVRWKDFREAERKINPDSPPIKWWWWIFETVYCIVIGASAITIWMVSPKVYLIIERLSI